MIRAFFITLAMSLAACAPTPAPSPIEAEAVALEDAGLGKAVSECDDGIGGTGCPVID